MVCTMPHVRPIWNILRILQMLFYSLGTVEENSNGNLLISLFRDGESRLFKLISKRCGQQTTGSLVK